jgi:hypothetical protein
MSVHNRHKGMQMESSSNREAGHPAIYQIRIKGHLGRQWPDWFGCVAIDLEDTGSTLLTAEVADQAALHGILRRLRDLGMPLLSVNRVDPDQARAQEDKP